MARQAQDAGGPATLPVSVEGQGTETLFFVHGWPDDEHLWDGQVEKFRSSFRCVRVTMPHFGGRSKARALGHTPTGYDFSAAADLLAATIEKECPGGPVILVLHDWGCVWGMIVQSRFPSLVRAVVALDVALSAFPPDGLGGFKTLCFYGILYQYWLMAAYVIAHSSTGTPLERPGRALGDWMALSFARKIGAPVEAGNRITADACYPYFYVHRRLGLRAHLPDSYDDLPTCPSLFIYGTRKAVMFHGPGWAQKLSRRVGCKVVPLDAGHWLTVERPLDVNSAIASWLEQLPARID